MKLKYIIISALSAVPMALSLTGCYEDKGNYTYSDMEEVTCEFPQSISAMQNSDYIEFDPVIKSSFAGEIKEGSSDYSFSCQIQYDWRDELGYNHPWQDVNPEGTKKVRFFASYPANNYTLWYKITNNKTDVSFDFKVTCSILSTTSSGWMVLSNVGADRKVCMDVIFPHPSGDERIASNVFGESCPELHNGHEIRMNPSLYSTGDRIYVTSESGTYRMNTTTLQFNENDNMMNFEFSTKQPGQVTNWFGPYYSTGLKPSITMCVTSEQNAFAITGYMAGAGFEFPLNCDVPLGETTYKVSRFMGASQTRPGNSYHVLLYDITNKRFVGFNGNGQGDYKRMLIQYKDPEDARFSFKTDMDIVDMESTAFSDGEVYSVLQDNSGKRHVYGIYVNGWSNEVLQDKVYECNAADFDTATDYAFHSQYPFMFYCKDNKVYCYNLGTGAITDTLDLDPSEKTSLVKFNMFQNGTITNIQGYNGNPEFQQIPYRLIVGSNSNGENGGIVRFYNIDETGHMSLYKEFKGLSGEIADVTYHERR